MDRQERKRKFAPDETLVVQRLEPLPRLLEGNTSLRRCIRRVDKVQVEVVDTEKVELTLDLLLDLAKVRVNLRDDELLFARQTRRLESCSDGLFVLVVFCTIEVGKSDFDGGNDGLDDEGSDAIRTDGSRVRAPG